MEVNQNRAWEDLLWAFSPCPNDTFIFEALVEGKLNGYTQIRKPMLLDIRQLNELADKGTVDVVKISAAHYRHVEDRYQMLDSGAAMGFGVGPLLVARKGFEYSRARDYRVAIPGDSTTAATLMRIFFPNVTQYITQHFSQIADMVERGEVDMGLLIHEGRFTYMLQDLICVADLGDLWENSYGLPLPLGLICVKRSLPEALRERVANAMRESVLHALSFPDESCEFVLQHAAEMDPDVQRAHINLYVNRYTEQMGLEGRAAIDLLMHLQSLRDG